MKIYPTYFTAGDRTPFTYFLRHKITKEKYYGSRTRKGCKPQELGVTYFTSSKIVRQIIKNEGKDIFEYRVARIFPAVNKCLQHESKFLFKHNAANDPTWLNKLNSYPHFSTSGNVSYKGMYVVHHPNYGYKRIPPSELSLYINLGYTRGWGKGSTTGKISVCHLGLQITKFIFKNEFYFYEQQGYVKGTLNSNKGKFWVKNEITKQCNFIPKNKLGTYLNIGYILGRLSDSAITKNKKSILQKGRINIKNESLNKMKKIHPKELEFYLNKGWTKGRLRDSIDTEQRRITSVRGLILIRHKETNISRRIKLEEFPKYENEGWEKGGPKQSDDLKEKRSTVMKASHKRRKREHSIESI